MQNDLYRKEQSCHVAMLLQTALVGISVGLLLLLLLLLLLQYASTVPCQQRQVTSAAIGSLRELPAFSGR